jgi:hypothetical protein
MGGFSIRSERGLAKVVLAVTTAFTMSLVAMMLVPAMNASAALSYAAEADVKGSTPALSATEGSFLASCPDLPPSNGVDAWVFELPAVANGEIVKVTPVSSDGPGEPDMDLAFYDAGPECAETGRQETAATTESGPLPAGTKFVVAIVFANMEPIRNTHVCLTVGSAQCGAASASASGSASASASASKSPSGSASPTHGSSPSASSSPTQITTTIESNRPTTKYNKKFTLSGRVNPGEGCQRPFEVTLRKRKGGSNTATLLRTGIPVEKNGTWSFSTKSKVSATYTATVTSGNSTTCETGPQSSTDVGTRVGISVDFGGACNAPQQVVGRVKPKHPKTKVLLKRKAGGKFKTVDKDKLNKRSAYDMTSPSCSGKFQVVWPAQDPSNAAGKRTFAF